MSTMRGARAAGVVGTLLGAGLSAATLADPVTAPAEGDLALTIYRQGAAMVHDRREVEIRAGEQLLHWPGVAQSLKPDTVRLRPDEPELLGYRLQRQPVSIEALLRAYEGREVALAQEGTRGREVIEARLISAQPPLVELDGEVRSVDPSALIFTEGLPPPLGRPPTLALELGASGGSERQPLGVSYIAGGFSWAADYVATLADGGERLDLVARATITNDGGLDIASAQVELIAGQPAFPGGASPPPQARLARESMDMAASGHAAEPIGDLQRYALTRPLTLADGERHSRRLFARSGLAVERQYVVAAEIARLDRSASPGWRSVPVTTELTWISEGPLPAGTVRVYRGNGDETRAQFIGGDRVADRPAGQPVRLELGRPFDVTARRRQTEYERLGPRAYAVAHTIELHNGRSSPTSLRVEEGIPGDWRITQASETWEREAAGLAVWRVELAAGETRELRYRARIER